MEIETWKKAEEAQRMFSFY